MEENLLIFVYGSLRRGEMNHYMIENYPCLHDMVWIYGRLYDADMGYPFLKLCHSRKVEGEIYLVPKTEIHKLDDFEDYKPGESNNLYERREVVAYSESQSFLVEVYVCNKDDMLKKEILESNWVSYRIQKQNQKR